MSRGLGTAQRLMLKALGSLETEHNRDEGLFYVWAIVDRAMHCPQRCRSGITPGRKRARLRPQLFARKLTRETIGQRCILA